MGKLGTPSSRADSTVVHHGQRTDRLQIVFSFSKEGVTGYPEKGVVQPEIIETHGYKLDFCGRASLVGRLAWAANFSS